MTDPGPAAPGFSVARGNPTPEELAALTVVLSAMSARAARADATDPPDGRTTAAWASSRRRRAGAGGRAGLRIGRRCSSWRPIL